MSQNASAIKDERYLTPQQLAYFRERLLKLRQEHQKKITEHLQRLQTKSANESDAIDRASMETDRSLEIQARDREQLLILKINQALERIDNGMYGLCEETGVPIGFSRLEAYPMATLSLEAQTRSENLYKRRKV